MQSAGFYDILRRGSDIILSPKGAHTHTIIFLHGLGDTAKGFLDLFTEKSNPATETTKIVLLTAPTRPVTINMGMKMPSWFDFKDFDVNESNFKEAIGVDEAYEQSARIKKILDEEYLILNENSEKIFLGGFSQGAAMTLLTGLTYSKPLGGLIAFSGFNFPGVSENTNNSTTPILISHGAQDPLLPWMRSKVSYEKLDKDAHKIKYEVIDGLGHSFNQQSINAFKKFLQTWAK